MQRPITKVEYLIHPKVREAAEGFLKSQFEFEEMFKVTGEIRQTILANQQADPAAAARLVALLDERMNLLTDMIATTKRIFTIIATAGASSSQPKMELRAHTAQLLLDQKVLASLIEESKKIIPGSGAGPKAVLQ